MYMMRRVHAEQSPKGGSMNVWVYQWESADLNDLIDKAKFNLKPFNEIPGGTSWEDHTPDQKTLPGCVWQGRTDEVFNHEDNWHPCKIHTITHCMIFNISKCWYSSVFSRGVTEGDKALYHFNCKIGDEIYPSFPTIKECVDYLTSPEGLGVCFNRDIKPVESAA